MALAPNNQIVFIPPATSGINAIDPLSNMRDTYCLSMTNFYPESTCLRVRKGMSLNGPFASPTASTRTGFKMFPLKTKEGDVRYLTMDYDAATPAYYDGTISGGLTSIGSYPYQAEACFFKNRLFVAGGGMTPRTFTYPSGGPFTFAATGFTGTGLTVTNLKNPWSYKNRLYYCEANSTDVWFGPDAGVTGTLTKLPLDSWLSQPGTPLFGGKTQIPGDLPNQAFWVVVTNSGEMLVFTGSDPAATDWQIYGTYFLPKPVHSGSFFYYGSDLHIVTIQGMIAVSDVLRNNKEGNSYVTISKAIDPEFADYISDTTFGGVNDFLYRPSISETENVLYMVAKDVKGKYTGDVDENIIYIMNLTTKAWGVYVPPTLTELNNIISNVVDDRFWSSVNEEVGIWFLNQGNLDSYGGVDYSITATTKTYFVNANKMINKKFNKHTSFLRKASYLSVGSAANFNTTYANHYACNVSSDLYTSYRDINKEGSFLSLEVSVYSADENSLAEYHGSFLSYEPGSNIP